MAISKKHMGFKRLVGDASNHTFGIAIDETSHAMHIFDATDAAEDWNVSAYSDPTILVHCADSNAPTDYIKIWHDDTDANIDCYGAAAINFGIGGTNYVEISSTALYPTTTDVTALGTSALMFSDVYLDSGAVIDFSASDVTITHSSGVLTIDGSITMADAKNIAVNGTTGTKIGTASSQKIGFYNAAPVVQQAHIVDADSTDAHTKLNTLLSYLDADAGLGLLAGA